jgi:hypothetical protein
MWSGLGQHTHARAHKHRHTRTCARTRSLVDGFSISEKHTASVLSRPHKKCRLYVLLEQYPAIRLCGVIMQKGKISVLWCYEMGEAGEQ